MHLGFKRNPIPAIFFTVFVDLLGFGILIPIVPQLLANPHSNFYILPSGWSVQQGYILLGFLITAYPFAQFISAPILGQLSDKYGRKPVLAISLLGTCLSYVLFAIGILTRNIPLLFFSRLFDGVTGGNISVAQAAIADVSTPQNRAKNFGLIGAAFGLGFILGPYVGGKISDPRVLPWFHAATPFWFAAIISLLNVLSVLFLFPETHKKADRLLRITWSKAIHNIIHAYTHKKLRILFMTVFLFNAGFTFFTTFFSVFLINRFSFSQGDIGDFFSYIGLWIVFTQAYLTRKVSGKFQEIDVVRLTLLGTGLCILLFFIPHRWWGLLLIAPIFAIANGLSQANVMGLVSKSTDAKHQGEILGVNASVMAFAQAIPPILSGYIAAWLTPEMPIVVASALITFSGFIFFLFYKQGSR